MHVYYIYIFYKQMDLHIVNYNHKPILNPLVDTLTMLFGPKGK